MDKVGKSSFNLYHIELVRERKLKPPQFIKFYLTTSFQIRTYFILKNVENESWEKKYHSRILFYKSVIYFFVNFMVIFIVINKIIIKIKK